MLIRVSSVFSILALAAAGIVAIAPAPASAAPCNANVCAGGNSVGVIARGKRSKHGTHGRGGPILPGPATGVGPGCPTQGLGIGCQQGPPPGPLPTTATTEVAGDAADRLVLPPPDIHTSPNQRSYVRLKTGLWVDDAFTTLTASATDPLGVQRVTATATPQEVTWNMVEGTKTCQGPGRPNSTACSYTYQRSSASQPGGKYRISATITWSVHWVCEGACDQTEGDLDPMPMTSFLELPVQEIQTESQPG